MKLYKIKWKYRHPIKNFIERRNNKRLKKQGYTYSIEKLDWVKEK